MIAMELNFRLAVPADAASLGEFMTRNFLAAYAHTASPENVRHAIADNYAEAAQQRQLSDENNLGLIALSGEDWAGHALMTLAGAAPEPVVLHPAMELARFYVDTCFHGCGVAQELMARVKQMARQRGAASLWLSVAQSSQQAIRFYQKEGFRIAGELVYMFGDDPKDDWLMICDLSA
jgi:ribosomal protein S18 acetylase RimI-like enzyme